MARDAIEKLKAAFGDADETMTKRDCQARIDRVVVSYGGDPAETRVRLDNLLK